MLLKKGLAGSLVVGLCLCSCTSKKSDEGGNVLHLSGPAKIKGLDPAFCDDLYSGTEVSRVYEGLLQYHYLKRPYTLEAALAEDLPKITDSGKTLTFKIRKGVLFQDDPCFQKTGGKGRELVAQDFVYSLKRLADPELVASGFWILDGRVVGLNEWRDGARMSGVADYTKEVEGLKALDSHTLQIKLKAASYQFLYYLAMPFAVAVPEEAVATYGKDFIRNPVGTGPFIYSRQDSNLASRLVYVRNPTFRKVLYPSEGEAQDRADGLLEDAGRPIPFVDKVTVDIHIESQPMWLNFQAGKIDIAGIPKDNFAQVITPSKELADEFVKKGIKLEKTADLDITHESFNMMDPVVGKNRALRQAMSLAINVEPMIDHFYNGRALPAQGPIPPGLSGFDPKFVNPYRTYSLSRAKELMAKAGYPEGKGLPVLEYGAVSNSTSRQMTEYLQKSLADIGVKLKVNMYTWPEFQSAYKNRKIQVWGFAWLGDYPDAENFLQLFYSKNMTPGPNDTNYNNLEFDKLYDAALKLPDNAKRTELYKKMVKILVDDCPWIFEVHRLDYTLTQPWLKNAKFHGFDHDRARYYRIAPELKK